MCGSRELDSPISRFCRWGETLSSRLVVPVVRALDRTARHCEGADEHERVGREAALISRGVLVLAETWIHFVRRPKRTNRDHADRTGRTAALDRPGTFSSCAEL